ncbi:MAG: VIT domain-containing protein [Burkholderiales bacterium]
MPTISRHSAAYAWWGLPIVLLLAGTCLASSPRPQSQAPRMFVAAPAESPIVLQRLKITTEITGSVALTTVEMDFHNPNRRHLEGELQFPLLDGQQIVGFALDVNGKLRDAVPVGKARGQEVFEDITRRGVDPGLLQTTEGNNFKLRVYPIFAGGKRTVAVRYSENLDREGGRGVYRLPLAYGARVAAFSLAIAVKGATARPVLSGADLPGLAWSREQDAYTLATERRDQALQGVLEVAVALPAGPRTLTQIVEGRRYFFAEMPVGTRKLERSLPAVVGLLWDSSASGAARNHAREFELLEAYFQRMRNGEVRLTRLRDAAEPAESFRIVNGDWRALRRALETTVYDGATNFGAVVPDPAAGEYLLFSDGLANYGEAGFPALQAPLYAITSSAQANPSLLKHLAHRGGGRYVDLLADDAGVAAGKLLGAFERIESVTATGATELRALSPYPENGQVAIAGVLTEPGATVRVTLAMPGRKPRTLTLKVDARGNESALAAAFWARARVEELEADYAVNRAEILRVGRTFGIVTRETSLIVLEFVRDYVLFDIPPPPELMAEYERVRQSTRRAAAPDPAQKIERVVAMLNEKDAWWKREFPKGRLPAPVEERRVPTDEDLLRQKAMREQVMGSSVQDQASRVPPVPMAKSPPPPAPKPAPKPEAKPALRMEADARSVQSGEIRVMGRLAPGTSDPVYLARLRDAAPDALYRIYLDERPNFRQTPAFYFDTAHLLLAKGQRELALRVLSNLAEIDLENRQLLRALAQRLIQLDEPRLAIALFRKVAILSPEEPQSFRDLGVAYAVAGDAQRAIDNLYEVVIRPWNARFPGIELIALADLNAIVATAPGGIDVSRIDPRLLRNLPLDLRAVLSWDTDNTNIDLVVWDPNKQQSRPGTGFTYQGGRMSQNYTGGYGPEEYSLRNAKPGKYQLQVVFVGHRQQVAGAGPTRVTLWLHTKFGTAQNEVRSMSVLLRPGEMATIAELEIPGVAEEDR